MGSVSDFWNPIHCRQGADRPLRGRLGGTDAVWDVIEGVDHESIPAAWWDLDAEGKRWQGCYRIHTKLPEVLEYNLAVARDRIFARPCFDGVFHDCWHVEDVLGPRSAALRDGRAEVIEDFIACYPRASPPNRSPT